MKANDDLGVTMAIAPTSSGLGYIAFENPDLPMDWGIKDARVNKSRSCVAKAGELMDTLRPSVLVLET
jgi:hypothetical protein